MARKTSITKRLKEAEFAVEQAHECGDREWMQSAADLASRLRSQAAIVREKMAERGTIGQFRDGTFVESREVIERRQRSAVTVGDRAMLPLVGSSKRASPNYLLRSAVFAVLKKGQRAALTRQRVASQNGYEILFSGMQLDQADLDVWLHCLHLSSGQLGKKVEVGLNAFLRDIGRTTGTASQNWLRDSLVRLGMAVIQVKHDGVTIMVSDRMVVYEEREQTSKSVIALMVSPTMARLFGVARWTALDLAIRTKLVGLPLAQWLHAYLATHAKPIPVALALLRELSGSRTAELRMFRRTLKLALGRLVDAGFLKMWEITADDKLNVIRA